MDEESTWVQAHIYVSAYTCVGHKGSQCIVEKVRLRCGGWDEPKKKDNRAVNLLYRWGHAFSDASHMLKKDNHQARLHEIDSVRLGRCISRTKMDNYGSYCTFPRTSIGPSMCRQTAKLLCQCIVFFLPLKMCNKCKFDIGTCMAGPIYISEIVSLVELSQNNSHTSRKPHGYSFLSPRSTMRKSFHWKSACLYSLRTTAPSINDWIALVTLVLSIPSTVATIFGAVISYKSLREFQALGNCYPHFLTLVIETLTQL